MKRWFYDFGFFIFALLSLPRFFGKLKQAESPSRLLRERFGIFSKDLPSQIGTGACLWVHAVSVGEVMAVEKFLHLLLERNPDLHVLLTTVTPTGQRIAKPWESPRLRVLYFPFDFQFSVARFFQTFKPAALLLVETEIWPNVIEEAKKRGVPVGIVNGRISERSFRAFRFFSGIFRPFLESVRFFLVQTSADRERLLALGVPSERVQVTGNMKLDALDLNGSRRTDPSRLGEAWGFSPGELVLVGGSTHPGEEKILLRALRKLRGEGLPLKLLLAPRHIERSGSLLKEARREGFQTVLASAGNHSAFEVLILDKLGELRKLYPAADAVFMGGSLVRHGGQNPVEAAAFRRPVIHGPWVFNFKEIYRRLDEEGASLNVQSEEELSFILKRILVNEQERKNLGDRAFEVLKKMRGATQRNLEEIEQRILTHETAHRV